MIFEAAYADAVLIRLDELQKEIIAIEKRLTRLEEAVLAYAQEVYPK